MIDICIFSNEPNVIHEKMAELTRKIVLKLLLKMSMVTVKAKSQATNVIMAHYTYLCQRWVKKANLSAYEKS